MAGTLADDASLFESIEQVENAVPELVTTLGDLPEEETIERLLGYRNEFGWTSLHLAVEAVGERFWRGIQTRPSLATRLDVLSALLSVVERPAHRHHAAACTVADQETVLHIAAQCWPPSSDTRLLAVGRRLVEAARAAGVLLDAPNRNGRTALQRAAAWRTSGLAGVLVEAGADINAVDANGDTPLIYAVEYSHTAMVELLLRNPLLEIPDGGLKVLSEAMDADGYAKESQSPSLLQVPEIDKSDVAAARRAELLEVLLPCRRINPSVLDEQGRTFLFRAGSWDIYGSDRRQQLLRDVIDLAQEAGVSLNHQDNDGNTVLHCLVAAAHTCMSRDIDFAACFELFAEEGVDASLRNRAGQLPSEVVEYTPEMWTLKVAQRAEHRRLQAARETRSQRYWRRARQQTGEEGEEVDQAAAGAARLQALPRAALAAAPSGAGSTRRRGASPDGGGRPQRRRRLIDDYLESSSSSDGDDSGSSSDSEDSGGSSSSDGDDSGCDSQQVCQQSPPAQQQQQQPPPPAQQQPQQPQQLPPAQQQPPPPARQQPPPHAQQQQSPPPPAQQPPAQPQQLPPPAQQQQLQPQQATGQQAAAGPVDLLQGVSAALAACVQAGRLQAEEQAMYVVVWRRLLSAESRQRDAAALRALAAGGRHEAAAALVRAALAQDLPVSGEQEQQRKEQRRQVQEEAAALGPLLERCVAAGALEQGAAAQYAAAFCRLMQPADRQADLQAFQAFAADGAWAALGVVVAAALAQELPS